LWSRYQEDKRVYAKNHPGPSSEDIKRRYATINEQLKAERYHIRRTMRPHSQERLVAESVAAFKALERKDWLQNNVAEQRAAARPPAWKEWVVQEAQTGDRAAQSQIRAWEYAQKRTPEAMRTKLEQVDARQTTRNDGVTSGIEWRRRWFLGGAEYKIDGRAAVIDKGYKIKIVDQGRASDRAIALGVALQATKRAGNVRIDGSRAFKERVADVAASQGLRVKFEDRKMQSRYEKARAAMQTPSPGRQAGGPRRPTVEAVTAATRPETVE
jgi:hypothetical protein